MQTRLIGVSVRLAAAMFAVVSISSCQFEERTSFTHDPAAKGLNPDNGDRKNASLGGEAACKLTCGQGQILNSQDCVCGDIQKTKDPIQPSSVPSYEPEVIQTEPSSSPLLPGLSAGFGRRGILGSPVLPQSHHAYSIARQAKDERIVMGGQSCIAGFCYISVVRFKADGSLDSSFTNSAADLPFDSGFKRPGVVLSGAFISKKVVDMNSPYSGAKQVAAWERPGIPTAYSTYVTGFQCKAPDTECSLVFMKLESGGRIIFKKLWKPTAYKSVTGEAITFLEGFGGENPWVLIAARACVDATHCSSVLLQWKDEDDKTANDPLVNREVNQLVYASPSEVIDDSDPNNGVTNKKLIFGCDKAMKSKTASGVGIFIQGVDAAGSKETPLSILDQKMAPKSCMGKSAIFASGNGPLLIVPGYQATDLSTLDKLSPVLHQFSSEATASAGFPLDHYTYRGAISAPRGSADQVMLKNYLLLDDTGMVLKDSKAVLVGAAENVQKQTSYIYLLKDTLSFDKNSTLTHSFAELHYLNELQIGGSAEVAGAVFDSKNNRILVGGSRCFDKTASRCEFFLRAFKSDDFTPDPLFAPKSVSVGTAVLGDVFPVVSTAGPMAVQKIGDKETLWVSAKFNTSGLAVGKVLLPSGQMDTEFGDKGWSFFNGTDQSIAFSDLKIAPDGRIYALSFDLVLPTKTTPGYMPVVLRRLTTDGKEDATFPKMEIVKITDPNAAKFYLESSFFVDRFTPHMALMPNGDVLIAVIDDKIKPVLYRVNSLGESTSLELTPAKEEITYSTNKKLPGAALNGIPLGLVINDGKAVVFGTRFRADSQDFHPFFAQVTLDGSLALDTNLSGTADFPGSSGSLYIPSSVGDFDLPYAMNAGGDGTKITNVFLAGLGISGGKLGTFAYGLTLTSGSAPTPHASFGTKGRATFNVLGSVTNGLPKGLAVASDGSVFITGQTTDANKNIDTFVAKLTSSGVLDTSFHDMGFGLFDFGTPTDLLMNPLLVSNGTSLLMSGGFGYTPVVVGVETK